MATQDTIFDDLAAQVEMLSGTLSPSSGSAAAKSLQQQDESSNPTLPNEDSSLGAFLTPEELAMLQKARAGTMGPTAAGTVAPQTQRSAAATMYAATATPSLQGLNRPAPLTSLDDGSAYSAAASQQSIAYQTLPPEMQAKYMQQLSQQQQGMGHVGDPGISLLRTDDERLKLHNNGAEVAYRKAIGEVDLLRSRLREITLDFKHLGDVGGSQINDQIPHSTGEELMLLFKICNLEVDKIRLMVKGYREQNETLLSANSVLTNENADLQRFRDDFLKDRRSVMKKMGDKITNNKKLIKTNAERERRHLERDLLNTKDQLKASLNKTSELEVTLTALKEKIAQQEKMLHGRGIMVNDSSAQSSTGGKSQPENKFLPPSAIESGTGATTSVQNLLSDLSTVEKKPQQKPHIKRSPGTEKSVGPSSETVSTSRPAEVFGLVVLMEEMRAINPERDFRVPKEFNELFGLLAREARMMVQCGKEMKGKPAAERDWRGGAYHLTNILSMIVAVSDLLHEKSLNDSVTSLLTSTMSFARDGKTFVDAAKNPRTEFDQQGLLPPFADFRPSMMTVIHQLKGLRSKF